MNIKNLGYYIAGQELKHGPPPPAKSGRKLVLKSKGCMQHDVESDRLWGWRSPATGAYRGALIIQKPK